MKALEQYFSVVLFIMLYKMVLSFEYVDEILKCDHSNESYWAVLSCGAVYYAVHGGSIFWVCGWNPKVWPFKWKLLSSTFLWCCLLRCTRWFTAWLCCHFAVAFYLLFKGTVMWHYGTLVPLVTRSSRKHNTPKLNVNTFITKTVFYTIRFKLHLCRYSRSTIGY